MQTVRVTATSEACELIERARRDRAGDLVITIGTGCCESTAPFLYEDFWPGPDQEVVGEAAGVSVFAPEYLRSLYAGDDALVIDVNADDQGESMSIETEYGRRFTLRLPGEAAAVEKDGPACATPRPRTVVGEMPEALRSVKLR